MRPEAPNPQRSLPPAVAPWQPLADALERDAPVAELRECFRQACLGPRGIPVELVERYQQRLSAARQTRRRRWLALGSIAAMILLIFGMSGYWLWNQVEQDRHRTAMVLRLDALLAAEEWEGAETLLNDLSVQHPHWFHEAEFQARANVCVERRLAEAARRARFREALQRAENAPPSDEVPSGLAQAEAQARTPEEHTAVRSLRERRQQSAALEKRHQAETYRQLLVDLDRQVNEFAQQLAGEVVEPRAEDRLDRWDAELVKAMRSADGIDPALVKQADAIRHRLPGLRAKHLLLVKEAQLLEQVTLALRTDAAPPAIVERFAEALEKYRREGKVDGRQDDFKAAGDRLPAWRAAAAWQVLWQSWSEPGLDLPANEAARRAEACERFIADFPNGTATSTARKLALWWSAAARQRPEVAGSPAQKLERLLTDPLLNELWVLPTTDGRVFYLRKDLTREIDAKRLATEVGQPSVKVNYVVDFDGTTKELNVPVAKLTKVEVAPHVKVIKHFRQLRRIGSVLSAWDEAVPHLLTAVQECAEMEPLLQLALVRRLTQLGAEGSVALAEALAEHRARLEKPEPPVQLATRWMDPNVKETQAERPKAQDVLKSLPPFSRVKERVQEQVKYLDELFRTNRHELWGWLRRGPRQTWEAVRLGGTSEVKLFVVKTTTGEARWEFLGTAGPGGIRLAVPPGTPEGQLIFSLDAAPPR